MGKKKKLIWRDMIIIGELFARQTGFELALTSGMAGFDIDDAPKDELEALAKTITHYIENREDELIFKYERVDRCL